MVSHKIDLLKKCDYLYYFKENRIFNEGKPDHLENILQELKNDIY